MSNDINNSSDDIRVPISRGVADIADDTEGHRISPVQASGGDSDVRRMPIEDGDDTEGHIRARR